MTDTPVPYESPSPAVLAHPAEKTEVTRVAGATGVVQAAERGKAAGTAKTTGTAKTAEAVRPPAEDDDLVIENLSEAAWPIPAPGICICTVGAD
ncbi:hypothetical protein [Streptomyces rugosispiralis]|uniref:Uncharacterized protein n=1 Tax=Streptomyces rugosispiralis TaxID=2967341 RepID=A0ABT1V189_9ACTN|nr:hypothetical protein [Streptomyces rugosispiralis]MCQ8191154.1 hypothetical protein [Streptomyces rugosispiralis]